MIEPLVGTARLRRRHYVHNTSESKATARSPGCVAEKKSVPLRGREASGRRRPDDDRRVIVAFSRGNRCFPEGPELGVHPTQR